eukprot:scaffold1529_cov86-Cylindrotheca_fusiformis.AAC.14
MSQRDSQLGSGSDQKASTHSTTLVEEKPFHLLKLHDAGKALRAFGFCWRLMGGSFFFGVVV